MVQKWKGVELVNCSPPHREGPIERLTRGKYRGLSVVDVIRRDPRYFMWMVKEWLDITPRQATIFEAVTGGGEIPSQYIRDDLPQRPSAPDPQWSELDLHTYWTNQDLLPNYDFDPKEAPSWWKRCKEKLRGETHPSKRLTIYRACMMNEFLQIRDSLNE